MEKEQKKNETKEKKPLTEQQRRQRQKMLVYPLMVLLFAGCLWLIFAPSSEDKEKERQGQGFNTDMPLPEDSKIIGDKAKAYEQQDLENKRKERRGMVGDLSAFWNDGGENGSDTASDDYRLTRAETPEDKPGDETRANIRTSAAAYQRLNTSLGTFYEPPKEDTEKEELRERIDELEAMLVARWRNKWPCWKSPTNWRRSTRTATTPGKPCSQKRRRLPCPQETARPWLNP